MVSERKRLGGGGMFVNGYGRKGGGFGDWFFFFSNGNFSNFGPPGMEGDSRRGGGLHFQVICYGGRGKRMGLVKGIIMVHLSFHLGRLFILGFCLGGVGGWFRKSANYEEVLFR